MRWERDAVLSVLIHSCSSTLRLVTPVSQNNPSAVTGIVTVLWYMFLPLFRWGALCSTRLLRVETRFTSIYSLCSMNLNLMQFNQLLVQLKTWTNVLQFWIHIYVLSTNYSVIGCVINTYTMSSIKITCQQDIMKCIWSK